MNLLDKKIIEYSQELSVLFIKMKSGEVNEKKVQRLSKKLDRLILRKMTFIEKDRE